MNHGRYKNKLEQVLACKMINCLIYLNCLNKLEFIWVLVAGAPFLHANVGAIAIFCEIRICKLISDYIWKIQIGT